MVGEGPGRKVRSRTREQLVRHIHDELTKQSTSPDRVALLYLNINDMGEWYDTEGEEKREAAISDFWYGPIGDIRLLHRERLHRAGRFGFDGVILYDTGHPSGLSDIASELKEAVDNTDPVELTCRISVAHQQNYTMDISGLLETVIEKSSEAKTAPGQILVVKYE